MAGRAGYRRNNAADVPEPPAGEGTQTQDKEQENGA